MRRILTSIRRIYIGRAPFLVALFVSLSVLTLVSLFPSVVRAQGDFGIARVDQQIALSGDSIVLIILRVIRILLGFLGVVLVILILYAGYTIMTSAGNEDKVEQGKVIIKNAVIGTAVILFSFIIVQFVINILGGVTGVIPHSQQQPPGKQTFVGVGSLGDVIKDHYPEPNQTDVYRNTKIVVTFTDEIDPTSIIDDTNGSDTFGDCTDVVDENGLTTRVCDTLKAGVVSINRLSDERTIEGDTIEATALASYEGAGVVHTFVFKPRTLLGNEESDQWHRVTIANTVKNVNGDSVFAGRSEANYYWDFQTNTEVDLTPPYVVDVSPDPGEHVEKNRVLKITFNEPVDPMMVQGILGPNSSFHNIVISTQPVQTQTTPVETTRLLGGINQFYPSSVQMATDATFLYVADSNSIKTIQKDSPEIVDTMFVTNNDLHSFAIDADRIYIVAGVRLHVFDAQTKIQLVESNDLFVYPTTISISGAYAYVADGDHGVHVIDINPDSATFLNAVATVASTAGASVKKSVVVGDKLYIIYDTAQTLDIVDISTPTSPNLVASLALGQTPTDLAVYGTTVYIATGQDMKIIDASQPSSNSAITQLNINDPTLFGSPAGALGSLFIADDILFAGQYGAMKALSIKETPLQPTFLFSYPETDAAFFNGSTAPSFTYSDGVVFVQYVNQPILQVRVTSDAGGGQAGVGEASSIAVEGSWKVTNGYRSVEFVSNEECGINSCGEPIYCLPTNCADSDKTCSEEYAVLARTASLDNPDGDSFVSAGLFDGVEDLATNAMDSAPELTGFSVLPGAHDFLVSTTTVPRHKPPINNPKKIDSQELSPDNYWWYFTVDNVIDTQAPYIEKVSPGIDQPGVGPLTPVQIYFSKEMMSFDNISILEYPDSAIGLGVMQRSEDVKTDDITKTILRLEHPARPFGMFGIDHWYFPSIPGTVKAMNQFCMYPGRGPDATEPQGDISTPACDITYNDDGSIKDISACIPASIDVTSSTDTGCISTNLGVSKQQQDMTTCVELFRNPSVSPTKFQ
ncbi:MAG: hypothetical protein COU32_00355 [Candidatus Magasanikbacteria bacterium CG10_big_fil_rev_8_21_14_0_10_42_10]|uniref:SbsA Ig-like domain-containing protein n=2 Tax=Candidatus Magasanikiibacteriota TaxID=1752731 RepID=A0A2H0TX88_9BACT|nr:MAG: hypothetical protein COU32_00355 [Candidatus Magasanikbacteria bacterium CG10_big_fil_rev_8_21_14_0_10_42_10]PIZ92709.1 MAG: hypothetical protein COX82_04210 [Candidatus Magasanikbacteria bacterium CG_4_10_14_0_2_um_filter_41_10]